MAVELLSITEIGKVLVVCEDLESLHCALEEVVPLIQGMHDGQHLLIMDLVVTLCMGEPFGHECNWLVRAICLCLGENHSSCKVGGITLEAKVAGLGGEGEDRGRGDSLLQGIERFLFG